MAEEAKEKEGEEALDLLPKYIDEWLNQYPSPHTRRNYRRHLDRLITLLGKIHIVDAEVGDLLFAARALQDTPNVSNSTFSATTYAWRSFYKYLRRRSIVRENPAELIVRMPAPEAGRDIPTQSEVRRMWRLLRHEKVWKKADPAKRYQIIRDRYVLAMFLSTGVRNAELRGLQRKHFDIRRRRVTVLGKRRRIRTQYWDESVDKYILPMLKRCATDDAYVLTGRGGTPYKKDDSVNGMLALICKRAGAERYTAHQFRHFAATWISEKHGIDRAMKFLGHSTSSGLSTSMRYDQRKDKREIIGSTFDDEEPEGDNDSDDVDYTDGLV